MTHTHTPMQTYDGPVCRDCPEPCEHPALYVTQEDPAIPPYCERCGRRADDQKTRRWLEQAGWKQAPK